MQISPAIDLPKLGDFLARERYRSSLRFITCGSVDDGKSTLIGRLLYESNLLFDDQVATLEADSKRVGTQPGGLDFSLLVDGLAAEREQGITIDVAYRYFATDQRKFIVADTPGHEQYTRNMATGASLSELAIILVDARKGLLAQTRRHSIIVSMLAVRHVVLAVNKIDLVDYSAATFARIEREFRAFAHPLGFTDIQCIPISALRGDNVVTRSTNTPWYGGPSLLDHLDAVEVENDTLRKPFRMPVQWVNRPSADFRGYAGLIASGTVFAGDRVRAMLSGRESRVARIATFDGDLASAGAQRSVTLVLEDQIDISRGDLICTAAEPASLASAFEARLLWMADAALVPGQPYLLRIGTRTVTATVDRPGYVLNINTLERETAETLRMNETGGCRILLDQPVAFDPYADNRDTGAFILIDRLSNDTLAMGFVERAAARPVAIPDRAKAAVRPPVKLAGRLAAWIGEDIFDGGRSENHRRWLVKAASWRMLGTAATLLLVLLFTGDGVVAIAVAAADVVVKALLYWAHERGWRHCRGANGDA